MNTFHRQGPSTNPADGPAQSAGRIGDGRWKLRRIRELLAASPGLAARYEQSRNVIRAYRAGGYYEITQRCNLKCEGCYYFVHDSRSAVDEVADVAAWEGFFASEARRGVSMGYFVGAEPALHPERLATAVKYIPYGTIGSNGTLRIDPAIPYKIHISVWGDDDLDGELRGGSVFGKALRNYRDDPRAIAVYTFNHRNIRQARGVALRCRDHGMALTFSLYSPTTTYLRKLDRSAPNDREFFRLSRAGDNLVLTADDYAEIRAVAGALLDEFPGTVVYSHAYNRFVTSAEFRYDIDPATGWARDCHSRIRGNLQYFDTSLHSVPSKCCTPDVDCSYCRLSSGGWSGRLDPSADDLANVKAFADWIGMLETIQRIYLHRLPGARVSAEAGND